MRQLQRSVSRFTANERHSYYYTAAEIGADRITDRSREEETYLEASGLAALFLYRAMKTRRLSAMFCKPDEKSALRIY